MEKSDKPMYDSHRVIGKLFREVKGKGPLTSSIKSFTKQVATKSYDTDMEVDGFEDYISEAFDYKSEYDCKLGNLMDYYGIETEAEILSGGIMKMSRSFDQRNDAGAVGRAVTSLRKEARTWFNRNGDHFDDACAKASAWYHVTYHPKYWGCYNKGLNRAHYISFTWCVYDKLIQIKKASIRRSQQISSLELQFSHGLRFL